jgi:adenosylhomocysteine nucleosidase
MTRIAIIAALPGELKHLVRGWHQERHLSVDLWRTQHNDVEFFAACGGMGKLSAANAFSKVEWIAAGGGQLENTRDACEKYGKLDMVISAGWAGALRADFEAGKAYRAAGVIDLQTGERYTAAGASGSDPWLVTSPRVATAAEKRRLVAEYGAGLVDMEAAAIARLAAMRGIPFQCIKGVSDGFDENLPDFNRFISSEGQLRLSRMLFFVLPRPWCWPSLIRMGENSNKASHSLTGLLLENLEISGDQTNPNGDSNFSR